jgi:multicomponent K+:H+ antiporter subunit A
MSNQTILIPLVACLIGALLAALFGHPALNRRLTITQLCWLVALAPLAAFAAVAGHITLVTGGGYLLFEIPWMPTLGLSASLYLDSLSALFALLVSGIGFLVIVYTGYYFKGDQSAWRFTAFMLLFMFSMMGLVMAGDIITLFLFWEFTSITSYLLIGYKYKDEAARYGALKALFITAGGGVALLAGLLFVAAVSGGSDFVTILNSGDVLRAHSMYLVMLGLVALGAFTKSAQAPFHIWLPDAMTAPTPASAYLHSATMVKAGIYLMARFNPALGNTEPWFLLLSTFGLVTMLGGAYLGLRQNDLKALLAYSTVSQLGILMMLIGQDTPEAFKALVVGLTAHALYKCALFLVAGIVDHETGTRDLRRLGGIGHAMPMTVLVGTLAALSMAGLPPLFGFLAKETLLVTAVHPAAPDLARILFPVSVVIAGAFLLAQSAMLIWDTFLGDRRDPSLHSHEPPLGMLLAPAVPAILSLAIVLLPQQAILINLLATAAENAHAAPVNVSLTLWHGINLPLILSLVAIAIGFGLFAFRQRVRAMQMRTSEKFTANVFYGFALYLIDRGAYRVTRTQSGYLRRYLATMLLGMGALILLFRAWPPLPAWQELTSPMAAEVGGIVWLRLITLIVAVVAAAMSVFLRRDLPAILALGASGLAVAILMVLEPAPDIGLVQVVVDILAVVILVLALTRLPKAQRRLAAELNWRKWRSDTGILRDGLLALGSGLLMTVVVWQALVSRPRESQVTPFYEANARTLAGADDIVGAILIDFRAFDTLFEVVVFAMAGIGVYTLLRYAARTVGDRDPLAGDVASDFKGLPMANTAIRGIGGLVTSPLLQGLAYIALPLAMMLGLTHLLYGHDQPGDGFTAGVLVSLAVGFWYVVFGYEHTKERLSPWLQSSRLIGGGLLLVISAATSAVLFEGHFFAPVDYGAMINLPLPAGVYFNTGLLFELAIALIVLGSVSFVLDSLGHPGDDDPESRRRMGEYTVWQREGRISLPEVAELPTGDGKDGLRAPTEQPGSS